MIIDDQFDAGADFVGRSGVKRTILNLAFRPRLRPDSPKILTSRGSITYWTDEGDRLLTRDVTGGIGITLLHGESLRVSYPRNLERQDQPSRVAGRLPVPTVQHDALEKEWGFHFRLNYI